MKVSQTFSNFFLDHLEIRFPELKGFGAYNIYDSEFQFDQAIDNFCFSLFINTINTRVKNINYGCIINSFYKDSLPIGLHNYESHGDKKIKNHWLFIMSRCDSFDGGDLMLLSKPPRFDIFSSPPSYKKIHTKPNHILETDPSQYRLFDCIKSCMDYIFHVNIFTFDD